MITIVEIPKNIKKIKYIIKAILSNEFPRKSVYEFTIPGENLNIELGSRFIPHICFITWKTHLLVKSHHHELKKFVRSNPDFKFYFFTDNSQDLWMKKNFIGSKIYDIYSRVVFGASKADIFRICLLYQYGGFFFSVNKLVSAPLNKLIGDRTKFIVSFEPSKYVRLGASKKIPIIYRNNTAIQWGIISPPKHPILGIALNSIINNEKLFTGKIYCPPKNAIWNFDGPYMWTKAIDNYLISEPNAKVNFAGINFDNSAYTPKGSEFRYISEPSYLGVKRGIIIKE